MKSETRSYALLSLPGRSSGRKNAMTAAAIGKKTLSVIVGIKPM